MTTRRRTVGDWIVATRPWAFSASVVPVLAVAAWLGGVFPSCSWLNVALAVAVIVFVHAGGDVLSDCNDHEKGVDGPDSPNGVTWIHNGLFSVRELRRFALVLLSIGAGLGLVVLARSGWSAAGIGIAGLFVAFGYSFLKYRALGDLAIFIAFAALPALGVGFVAVGQYLPKTVAVVLPCGLLTMAILHANNTRDIRTDASAGCSTLPNVIGLRASRALYLAEVGLPYVLVAAYMAVGLLPYAALGTFLTLPLAVRAASLMLRGDLDTLDRSSAQLQLLFGVLYTVAFPVGLLDFWWQLSLASVVTLALTLKLGRPFPAVDRSVVRQLALGLVGAAVLWGVFWIGNVVSQALFGFAKGQVGAVYALRDGASAIGVGALLLLLIGPAEELFWRGLVQRRLSERLGPNVGFALATLAYVLIHVWSFNFMLIGAAAVCGLFWGGCYRFFPRYLPAIVLSHAVWDLAVFVLFPIT